MDSGGAQRAERRADADADAGIRNSFQGIDFT
jgi:hypothetical protein